MKNFFFTIILCLFFISCSKQNNIEKSSSLSLPLHQAVRANNKELADFLIKENKESLNQKDRFGYTPLHIASRFNHLDIAKILIENGAMINTQDKYGDTPLLDATKNNFTGMSKLLICNKANTLVEDKHKKKALDYALEFNNLYISKLIETDNSDYICRPSEAKYYKLISIDKYKTLIESNPTICGDILDPSVLKIQASFDKGETILEADINKDKNKWCVKSYRKLRNGNHLLTIMAINKKGQKALFSVPSLLNINSLEDFP